MDSVATTPGVIPCVVGTLSFPEVKIDIRMFFFAGLTSETAVSSDKVILLDADHVNTDLSINLDSSVAPSNKGKRSPLSLGFRTAASLGWIRPRCLVACRALFAFGCFSHPSQNDQRLRFWYAFVLHADCPCQGGTSVCEPRALPFHPFLVPANILAGRFFLVIAKTSLLASLAHRSGGTVRLRKQLHAPHILFSSRISENKQRMYEGGPAADP